MSLNYENEKIKQHMTEGNFGLERESLRVDQNGFLSHTRHPFGSDPHMERDFCENQTELITKVCDSAEAVWEELAGLHKKAVGILQRLESGPEVLWPFSSPPYVKGEEDIPIARYTGSLRGKELYRQYLAGKYGKKKMLFSGIHFNFSFSEDVLQAGYEESGENSFKEYKNKIYMELAKKVTKYSWLVVYLTAASTILDGSFFRDEDLGKDILKNYASPRCSEIGYWNDFIPILDYSNLDNYVRGIQEYVDDGQLKAAAELYYPVRLKPAGENTLDNLKDYGVNHIELRMLDLNPFTPIGIMKEDLKFLQLLIIYLTSLEDDDFEAFEQKISIENEKAAAQYEDEGIWIKTGWNSSALVRDAAMELLFDMEKFFSSFGKEDLLKTIHFQEEKVICPRSRYAVRVKQKFRGGYVKKGLELAKKYAEMAEEQCIQAMT